jgi:hypothetical protein
MSDSLTPEELRELESKAETPFVSFLHSLTGRVDPTSPCVEVEQRSQLLRDEFVRLKIVIRLQSVFNVDPSNRMQMSVVWVQLFEVMELVEYVFGRVSFGPPPCLPPTDWVELSRTVRGQFEAFLKEERMAQRQGLITDEDVLRWVRDEWEDAGMLLKSIVEVAMATGAASRTIGWVEKDLHLRTESMSVPSSVPEALGITTGPPGRTAYTGAPPDGYTWAWAGSPAGRQQLAATQLR